MSSRLSFRERFRRSFRSSGSSSNSAGANAPIKKISRRGSIFDLLYLLRRGSTSSRSAGRGEKEKEPQKSEQDAFVSEGEIEDDRQLTRVKLLAKIREKKAAIEKLRCQPWPMRRKRRTLILAQKYLQRHESKVSKTHLLKEEITRKWKKFKRWLANVSIYLIPWEAKIKTIESHFGSVVSSYFTFLRWIFWVNVIMTVLMVSFIVIPECLADTFPDEERRNDNNTQRRKNIIDPDDIATSDYFHTIWNYKGYITVSPLFYGYYSNRTYILTNFHYQLPLAYFLANLFTLGYSFFAILRRMAANTRMSKLTSGKTEQYTFAWKIFTGWDYTIGNAETAANTFMANANKLRETIMEFKTKQKEQFAWLLLVMRIFANLLIVGMIAGSTYVVYYVVQASNELENPNAFEQNQVAIVVSFITLVFPNFFELISKSLERFHPRTALRVHLGRILALYLLNFYTLIFALFTNITKEKEHAGTTTPNPSATPFPGDLTRDTASSYDSSLAHFRFGRSVDWNYGQENITGDPILEPLFQLGTFLLNVTSSAAGTLQPGTTASITAATPIPLLIHLLKSISRRPKLTSDTIRKSSTSSTFVSRVQRQTAGIRSSYYRYKTERRRRPKLTTVSPSSVTGPLLWTTVHPQAGTVGVNDANAYLLENISEWMRNNINSLETFPPFKRRNGTRPGPRITPTTERGKTHHVTEQTEHGQTGTTEGMDGPGTGHSGGIQPTKRPPKQTEGNLQRQKAALSMREKNFRCWETWVGQEIAKLITMDLVMTILSVLVVDFFRGLWVRYCNRWWCWSLETTFPEYGEFKVAENVLHIINNQGMIWLGLFFAPLLPAMNNVKLIIIMYVRGWACMTCNVPATQVFRASRSSNFYLLLLLLMLFLCTLPVGYVIAKQPPSAQCGPFSHNRRFYNVITDRLESGVPPYVYDHLENLASPGIIIPILVLLALIIYFLVSLVRGLREANRDLQKQLVHERTEEKRKIYQMAGGGKNNKGPTAKPSFELPETKKLDLTHLPNKEKTRREAWRLKPSMSDDESVTRPTDTEISSHSPSSMDTTSPASPSKSGYPDFPAPPFLGASSPSGYFIPSLKSLPEEGTAQVSEVEEDDDERQKLIERSKSETLLKPQSLPAGADNAISKSTPETATTQSNWEPKFRELLSPQQHLAGPGSSHSPSSSSSRSHSPLQIQPTPSALHPRFPTSADASLSLTQRPTADSQSWSPTTYDNNFSTPMSPMTPGSPTTDFADLTARRVSAMLSPSQFSPRRFASFLKAPQKKPSKPMDPAPHTTIIQTTNLVKTDVLIHMSDTEYERNPSDSGRATMTESADTPLRHHRLLGTETDTGTESDMEKFARARLQDSIDQRLIDDIGEMIERDATERDPLIEDTDERNGRTHRPKHKETKLFPKPISSTFVPWPAPDPMAPKSILKHHGPPGRRESASPSGQSPPRTPSASPMPGRRFTLSVSPSPVRQGDSSLPTTDTDVGGSPVGKKRYIIRQTPSPSPKFPRAHPEPAQMPTKLSVVSEITLLPRLSPKPASSPLAASSTCFIPQTAINGKRDQKDEDEQRKWAASTNNNKPIPSERPSRAQYPSRAQLVEYGIETPLTRPMQPRDSAGSDRQARGVNGSNVDTQPTTKSKKSKSKETMI